MVKAPVNVDLCCEWLGRLGLRVLHAGANSYADILGGLVQAAVRDPVRGGHWVQDGFTEARRPTLLGLANSLEVSPVEGRVSVFANPKMLRFIARGGVPQMTVVDVCNSHLVHMVAMLGEEEKPM
jgi:hypothetical protein